jgi:2-methylisocitrate lyase-like PEP mutase family enzyme
MGKAVVSREDFATRLRAAVQARSDNPSRPVLIARYLKMSKELKVDPRTDTIQTHNIDEAITRMKEAYAIGAEVAFIEGILDAEQARTITKALHPMPVLVNLLANGVTPNWTVKEATELGFKVCIFPFAGILPAAKAMQEAYKELMETGTDKQACESGLNPRKLFTIVGLDEALEIEKRAGGSFFQKA